MKQEESKAQEKIVKNQEKAIKQIIKRYGDTIDLRKSPYLIAEIIREYAHIFPGENHNNPSPGSGPIPGSHGTPPPPPPSSEELFDFHKGYAELIQRIEKLEKRF